MILRAKQEGDVLIFDLEGHLDFETTQEFKDTCQGLIKKHDTNRVVFNFDQLRFVGSSGINQFIQIMREFNNPRVIRPKPKLCQMSSEFEKVFRAFQPTRNPFDIFESLPEAVAAFDAPPKGRKRAAKKGKA